MAIDTAEKRRSVSGVQSLPSGPGVTPNASKDLEWRQQSGWSYSGIATAGAGGTSSLVLHHAAFLGSFGGVWTRVN